MNRTSLRLTAVCLCAMVMAAVECRAQDDAAQTKTALPLTTMTNLSEYQARVPAPLTISQQRARYAADMRMVRIEQNKNIGFEPLRPYQTAPLSNNEWNHYYYQPVRYRPVWGVWNYGSRIW
ncbi:MAG: hypothetical protein U0892_12735 [Pirellulales bacterium]